MLLSIEAKFYPFPPPSPPIFSLC